MDKISFPVSTSHFYNFIFYISKITWTLKKLAPIKTAELVPVIQVYFINIG